MRTKRTKLRLRIEEFGVVFRENRTKQAGSSLRHGVNFLNQAINVRGHHQEIPHWSRPRIPIGVRGSPAHKSRRTRVGFDLALADSYAQAAFQDIPSLIVAMVEVHGSDKARRAWGTAGGPPLGDHKGRVT